MSYIICFWDKSKLQVSDQAGETLKTAIREKLIDVFEVDKGLYAVGGVEKIISKYEAFDIFPSEYALLSKMTDQNTEMKKLEAPKIS